MSIKKPKYVVINGDDFGYSNSVNEAIITAHQQGILTSTSLMVTAEQTESAVKLAQQNPHLGVGLHLVLCCGKSALPPSQIPHLVDQNGYFDDNPAIAGLKYQLIAAARKELTQEIKAQLELFRATGLPLSHVDGHLHLHTHPLVLKILAELAEEFAIKFIRLPNEELNFTLNIDRSNLFRKTTYRLIFKLLQINGKKLFSQYKIKSLARVYGLLQTGKIDETYLLNLIPQITTDNLEIYSHPRSINQDEEFQGLCSAKVRNKLLSEGFQLLNYRQIEEKLSEC